MERMQYEIFLQKENIGPIFILMWKNTVMKFSKPLLFPPGCLNGQILISKVHVIYITWRILFLETWKELVWYGGWGLCAAFTAMCLPLNHQRLMIKTGTMLKNGNTHRTRPMLAFNGQIYNHRFQLIIMSVLQQMM